MKKTAILLLSLSSLLLSGCMAFNVGEPQRWTVDRGGEGKVVVTRQKKMSFGFFPAEAEGIWRPGESLRPLVGWDHDGKGNYTRDTREPMVRYPLFGLFSTPWAILVTPWHGDYICDSHHWLGHDVELLRLLPADAQAEIHVKTAFDGDRKWGVRSSFSHSAIIGFHRYATVSVEELDSDDAIKEDDNEK